MNSFTRTLTVPAELEVHVMLVLHTRILRRCQWQGQATLVDTVAGQG
jgi:hypothetical protein